MTGRIEWWIEITRDYLREKQENWSNKISLQFNVHHLASKYPTNYTCFKVKHLNKHKCDVDTSYCKGVFPHCTIALFLLKKILKRSLWKYLASHLWEQDDIIHFMENYRQTADLQNEKSLAYYICQLLMPCKAIEKELLLYLCAKPPSPLNSYTSIDLSKSAICPNISGPTSLSMSWKKEQDVMSWKKEQDVKFSSQNMDPFHNIL